nr:hypothetical protein [Euryarchaeota archaeon]
MTLIDAQRFIKGSPVGRFGEGMSEQGKGPVVIVRDETRVTSGIEVTSKLIYAAKTLASILRGTLGPRGLDKGLYKTTGEFAVTSDGARVLNDLLIKNPGAKLLVSLGQSQEAAIGDGVTSTVLFSGALLDEAGRLINKGVHPLVVVDGYLAAAKISVKSLEDSIIKCESDDIDTLVKVASTSLTGRAGGSNEKFSTMLVDAVQIVSSRGDGDIESRFEDILFDKFEDGDINDTRMISGVFWRQRIPMERMAGRRENVGVALLNCDIKQRESKRDTEIELQSAEDLGKFLQIQEDNLTQMAENILASGADIIVSSGEIERQVLHRLAAAGKVVISDVHDNQLVHLAKASGGTIVHHLQDLSADNLGFAGHFEAERRQATEAVQDRIIFDKCEGGFATIVVGGSMAVEETIRGMYDSIRATTLALSSGEVIVGGGASHMVAAKAVKEEAEKVADRTRLGMEAYARALEMIPWMLAANTGVNPLDALLELRAAVREGVPAAGIAGDGTIASMTDVLE